jgi:general stress protein YciG
MANTSKRGFASMDPAKQKEIASKGGRAAHAKGTAHEFTSDEARVAGRKGGETVSRDRQHMSAIGREGGHSRGTRTRESGDLVTEVEQFDEKARTVSSPGFATQDRVEPGRSFSADRTRDNDRAAGSNNFGSFNGRSQG